MKILKRTMMIHPRKRYIYILIAIALFTVTFMRCQQAVTATKSTLSFHTSNVIKSKKLYTIQKTPQYYKNKLIVDGKIITDNTIYKIIRVKNYFLKNIVINRSTGEITFKGFPETVTVQATHAQGKTARYTFTIADHFSARVNHSSVVVGDAIYVIGGQDNSGFPNDDVWKSSDGGVTWIEVNGNSSNKFSARSQHSSVVVDGAIYVIGGGDNREFSNDVWKSSDGGVTWMRVTPNAHPNAQFLPRFRHSSVVVDGAIYVIGGMNFSSYSNNDVWKSTDGGVTWIEVNKNSSKKFPERVDHSSVVVGSAIYVISGLSESHPISDRNDVWKSTDGGVTWIEVNKNSSKKFPALYGHSSVVVGSAIYVIGGGMPESDRNDVWKSTDGGVTWIEVNKNSSKKFPAVSGYSSVVVDGAIYVIGGKGFLSSSNNDVWKSTDGGVTWVDVHAAP